MGGLGGKNKGQKGKGRETQRSRSRNTTPSSNQTVPPVPTTSQTTAYLKTSISHIIVPSNLSYDSILEKHGLGSGSIPDPKHLEALTADLETMLKLAEQRANTCNTGMREASNQRKMRQEELRELEKLDRENAEREKLQREAEDEEQSRKERKAGKEKKRKNRDHETKERPLAVGAHTLAPQDGMDIDSKGSVQNISKTSASSSRRKAKAEDASGSTSSLSTPSQMTPPGNAPTKDEDSGSDDGADHQPPRTQPEVQYRTFGDDPSNFKDDTIYEILPVKDGMTDEELQDIYQVKKFPKSDLKHLIAGTPPDKDFTTTKPTNQVNQNTFATYLEPYVRPLTEEDLAFLKERGDRTAPFIMNRRGKKHYKDIWAEEDGLVGFDAEGQSQDKKLPPNQARGDMEQMTDDIGKTDLISPGPTLSRLLSAMRFTHHPAPDYAQYFSGGINTEDEPNSNANDTADGDQMDIDHPPVNNDSKSLPPATKFPEADQATFKANGLKLDFEQMEKRARHEIRYAGLFPQDGDPDYDAHFDDPIAERMRLLQAELKKQMIINGARKARILELARDEMSLSEYTHISDDLDNQVNASYLKRTRTLSKNKKHAKRPGGAGGGSHYVGGAQGISRPGIGDQAKVLMDRRIRWMDTLNPIFNDMRRGVPGENEDIFSEEVLKPYLKSEEEAFEEAQGE
ncbi:MAG: Transcriptional regulator [Cirrosporium novae-zelandiae]|nr:MAG: Transcriptional regulator [Cirrosporium novae-zelandiae]